MQTKYRLKSLGDDRTYPLDKSSTLIGRSAQCDISIDSGLLSRHHASVLVVNSDTVILKDLDSTNGTFVNTMRITGPTRLKHGDVITIGDEKFIFIDLDFGEAQVEYEMAASYEMAGLADGANHTMIESAFFRMVSLPEVAVSEPPPIDDNSLFMARVLGKKTLDANLTPAVLLVKTGIKRNTLIELKLPMGVDREWSLGRSQLCDVVLEDPTVSNLHAWIRWENGFWEIQDNHSTNGVSVNGKKVTRSIFQNGDTLTIGNIKMVFRVL
ncbi:FHA domain-containing protein [Saccharophagus sp. K07]|jgi:pSer/pThr/pTyr-binding forkhead associated (FHA) protein|uniref:FHA domain-containing protein n=1 Tax=Saccharophagus sp. K07 TaxID=2283636 RepID=UPI001651C1DB|nr:FHA domain-containing protein [Saccharophagus sp. K07]MBC6904947.1 FHA domain-containing protein [Saccharophagus sp. K07]